MSAHTPRIRDWHPVPEERTSNEWAETVAFNRKYDRDPRVIAARKQYRTDLKAGVLETDAWNTANAIYTAVRLEILNNMEVERNG